MDARARIHSYAPFIDNAKRADAMTTLMGHAVKTNTIGTHLCITTNYTPAKASGGYVQMRIDGRKYYCHIISAIEASNRLPTDGEEASHRCHNAKCVNPLHMVFESGNLNKSRSYCRLFKNHPEFKCLHVPECINTNAEM